MSRRLDVPHAGSFYGNDASSQRWLSSRLWRRAYGRLFERAAALIVEGPALGARLEGIGCPAEKVHVVPLPADAGGLAGIERHEPSRFTAVMAGRFVPKKGFDIGIRAFSLALRGRDAELLVIGGGKLEREYRRIAEAEGVASQVMFVGRLPFDRFMSRIGAATIGLYPSRTASDGDSEGGAPVTLIESQWIGVPSLISDHDDLPFAAGPGAYAEVPAGDLKGWAEALRAAFDDQGGLRHAAAAGAKFVRRQNDPSMNAARREEIYSTIIQPS